MKRSLITVLAVLYAVIAGWLLFLFPYTHASRINPEARRTINLFPFTTTRLYWHNALEYQNFQHISQLFINVGGNILLFFPLGCFLTLLTAKWYQALLIGALGSFLVESIQIFTLTGNFDVDDIIWNSTGVTLGYLIVKRVILI